MNLGKKIVIVGVSAAGKSTFARMLALKTKLPVTHMDAVMWQSGWNYVGDETTYRELDRISTESAWIIEGYISKKAQQFVFDRADSIIYLDYSPMVAAYRYIKRFIQHRKIPRPELAGSPEKFSFSFLKIIWTKRETKFLDEILVDLVYMAKTTRLRSLKNAKNFLESVS
jgi:adenylate kinase family enzyme